MSELTPEAFVKAVLAIVADPKVAKQRADELNALADAKAELEEAKAEHNAREKELEARGKRLDEVEGEHQRERERQAKAEASLEERAKLVKAGEDSLQNDRIVHANEHHHRDENLNMREQAVKKLEAELEEKLAKLAADRELLDKKLAAAKAFVEAA